MIRFRTEKNCINWAKEYFEAKLTDLSVEKDGVSTKITSVTSVTGDVDLNQRKGKIITLYDMVLKLCWKGKLICVKILSLFALYLTSIPGTSADGVEAEGRITIPEVAHDTDPSDYVFEITVDADSRSKDPIRQVVRSYLSAEIKQVFATFTKDLIDSHSKDVYIDPSQLGTPSPINATSAAASQPEPIKKSGASYSAVKDSKSHSAPINTCTLKDTIEFVASAMDVFQALTDPTLVSIWTRSPATLSKEVDSSFSLFGGNIQGTVKEQVSILDELLLITCLGSWQEDRAEMADEQLA